uniref:helix-turn-helix domain-containing protein n=1 Tax=Levilactobacillus yonginensis TaxID=1054041 RepID=UPI002989E97C|nr:helix-turn-helix domain-containing protein [Levilactobacillus yonginensis]
MNRPKGHHLTLKERGNIEVYFNHDGYSRRKIAKVIGVSPQTINNEIKRGVVVTNKRLVNGKEKFYEIYVAELAEQRYHEKRKVCHRPCKFYQVLAFLLSILRLIAGHPTLLLVGLKRWDSSALMR